VDARDIAEATFRNLRTSLPIRGTRFAGNKIFLTDIETVDHLGLPASYLEIVNSILGDAEKQYLK
jgi:hypothetical protein